MQLARDVYRMTEAFPKSEIFGLSMQMRRAAVSLPSKIAEGHGRLTDNSLRVFLAQARGSLYERVTQAQVAADLGFVDAKETAQFTESCSEVARLLNGLLHVINKSAAPAPDSPTR